VALTKWMEEHLDGMVEDLGDIATELDATRSPCCERNRFHLWNNEDEARLHRRVIAARTKVLEILGDVRQLLNDDNSRRQRLREITTGDDG